MIDTVFGIKQGMTQTFVDETRVPVTTLKVGPCVVTQIKTQDKDGYWAVQLGFGERKAKNTTKPLRGHLKAVADEGKIYPRFLREVRFSEDPGLKIGDKLEVSDIVNAGDVVRVTSVSKGKGFAGVVKRHGFAGGPKTHGQSNRHRAPGSIGQGTTPGRVWKGKKMAGRMGSETVTIENLRVVSSDPEKGEIAISGSIPGPRGGFVTIKRIKKGDLSEMAKKVVEVEAQVEEVQEKTEEVTDGKN